jgi:hypothetical protein
MITTTEPHVYNLPLISQTVKYLHAAAGFPVKDTWTKAIKAGNYNTWPTIRCSCIKLLTFECPMYEMKHKKNIS